LANHITYSLKKSKDWLLVINKNGLMLPNSLKEVPKVSQE